MFDHERDIAIFRKDMNQENEGMGHIKLHQLVDSKQLDYDQYLANRRAFTIGYNSPFKDDVFPESRQTIGQLLTPEKRAAIETTEVHNSFYLSP